MSIQWSYVGVNGSFSGNGAHSVCTLQLHGAMEESDVSGLATEALTEAPLGNESFIMSRSLIGYCEK